MGFYFYMCEALDILTDGFITVFLGGPRNYECTWEFDPEDDNLDD